MDTILDAPAGASAAWRLADAACEAAGIRIVAAHDADAARRVSDAMGEIWGWKQPQFDTPLAVALAHSGGYVATVEQPDGTVVGAAMGFCGPPGRAFHSHILGLLPSAVGRGIGRAVKLAQRAWCLERGIDTMTWTFDPLVARNAFFNLRRLGATAAEYLPDFYGSMTDRVNAGQHTDRVLMRWDLRTRPPAATRPEPRLDGAHPAVADLDGAPSTYARPGTAATALVAVPGDIEGLRRTDPETARRWRQQTRTALTDLLGSGWRVVDFARPAAAGGMYVLTNTAPEKDPR
ncbi:hypothetical protein [Microbacterium marinilacus]|uniref:N-acetyltransferase domain-containing protein n=1 Tax=Microbacterium marinilacus TaxID=415209 RepID=A0ABP7BFD6_9MICO|nr:hypothetical protein [Microbacterium marinilacus]MBY0689565.1 hypothetical protein [Microbacterium marinilacus]